MTTTMQPSPLYASLGLPGYLHKYPEIALAAKAVSEILPEVRTPRPYGKYELEARFGTLIETRGTAGKSAHSVRTTFQNGVSELFFLNALENMTKFSDWKAVSGTEEMHDFFYSIEEEDHKSTVRTSVSFGSNLDKHTSNSPSLGPLSQTSSTLLPSSPIITPSGVHLSHMIKHLCHKQDCQFKKQGDQVEDPPIGGGAYDIRVSLSIEEDISSDRIPKAVNPFLVRLKQRKTFLYAPKNCEIPMWAFDFTRSWSGSSKAEAELKQRTENPIYEIECECLNATKYMETSTQHDETYLAASLLLKMCDLINSSCPFRFEPLKVPFRK